jgi:hypothetical protein
MALASGGTTVEVSQPVALQGNNAVQVEMTVFRLTATNVSVQLQLSNDLENWTDEGSAQTTTAEGYKLFTKITSLAAAYARLEFTLTGSGVGVYAAGINLSAQ